MLLSPRPTRNGLSPSMVCVEVVPSKRRSSSEATLRRRFMFARRFLLAPSGCSSEAPERIQ